MDTEYSMIDPWGNSRRDFPSTQSGVDCLLKIHSDSIRPYQARNYMEGRTWDLPVSQVDKAIEEIVNEKK